MYIYLYIVDRQICATAVLLLLSLLFCWHFSLSISLSLLLHFEFKFKFRSSHIFFPGWNTHTQTFNQKWWQFDQMNDVHGALKAPIKNINVFSYAMRRRLTQFLSLSLRVAIKLNRIQNICFRISQQLFAKFTVFRSPSVLAIQSN